MWNLIVKKGMLPTRLVRYCCEYLKESAGDGRMTITGVRWAESTNRKKNQGMVTLADKKAGKELADDPNFSSTNRGGGGIGKR
jgi:phosphoadenosine phosphosulfate reductase